MIIGFRQYAMGTAYVFGLHKEYALLALCTTLIGLPQSALARGPLGTRLGLRHTVTLHVADGPQTIVIDPKTHRGFVASPGALADNTTGPGTITVFDSSTGALINTVSVANAPGDMAVDQTDNRVVVTTEGPYKSDGNAQDKGTVYLLDATTGQVSASLDMQSQHEVALDEQTGQAFIPTELYPDDSIMLINLRHGIC